MRGSGEKNSNNELSKKRLQTFCFLAWIVGCEIHAVFTSFQLYYCEKEHELQFACY
jgi:hypothetical protein